MTGTGTYLYAVCGADPPPVSEVTGVDQAPVRTLADEGITAVVSDVDLAQFGEVALAAHLEDLEWVARVAGQHDAVVRAVAARTAALPLRLATIYRDDASLLDHLRPRRSALRHALDRVDGRVEWGVKVYAVAPEPTTADEPRPVSGTDYLRRRQARLSQDAQARHAAVDDAEAVFGALAPLAAASERTSGRAAGATPALLLSAAFLLDRSAEPRFCAAVEELADARPPGTISVSGPWPAYSFADWSDL